jgi:hypothetical protein
LVVSFVHEEVAVEVPADGRNEELVGRDPCLRRGVSQVAHGHDVFRVVELREVELAAQIGLELLPGRNQPFVDAVELVAFPEKLLEPLPLDDALFVEGGRRVGVLLEKLGRGGAVETQIEPAVAPWKPPESAEPSRIASSHLL